MIRSIKIGAKHYQVVMDATLASEQECGNCVMEQQLIRISKNLPETEAEETLLHEILHACCTFVGIGSEEALTEEQFISRISPTLYTVLRENDHPFRSDE